MRVFVGFVGLVQALPVPAELPAVIGAADAVLGRNAVRQRGAAMRTKLGDQTEPALPVLEENEIFAEQPHALRPFVGPFRPRPRSAASSGATDCRRAFPVRPGSAFVLLGSQHVRSPRLSLGFCGVYSCSGNRDQRTAVRAGMSGRIRIRHRGDGRSRLGLRSAIRGNPAFQLAAIAEPEPRCGRLPSPRRVLPGMPTCRRCCGATPLGRGLYRDPDRSCI